MADALAKEIKDRQRQAMRSKREDTHKMAQEPRVCAFRW